MIVAFLGMPWHFFPVLAFALVVLLKAGYRPKPVVEDPEKAKGVKAQFFGGPLDAEKINVPAYTDYHVQPYLPKVDDNTPREERYEITHPDGRVSFMPISPKLAYYQHVNDGQYFYKRDITAEEYEKLIKSGDLNG